MKLLGLIGGTSWHATVVYYEMINRGVSKFIGTQGNPELLIHSINIELMRAQDKEAINAKYLGVAKELETAGCEAIVICANTPHMTYDYVQPQINIPILHIADAVGYNAQKQGLKKLALFGNKPTITGNFISERLQKEFQLEILKPAPEVIEKSHYYVSDELTQGIFSEEAKTFYKQQIMVMKESGADGVILGCTELPILLKSEQTSLPLLATTDLHIDMAVDFILGK